MSTGPGHDRWADTAGAYVLGALPEDERTGFEAHVTTCEACRSEVGELAGAADALPVSAPAVLPPPALKARIMTYGARLVSLEVPDRSGRPGDIVLGYESLAGYTADPKSYFGAIVGRYDSAT